MKLIGISLPGSQSRACILKESVVITW